MGVLMEYLTHSSVSPLPSVFVEVVDPLASNVSCSCWSQSFSLLLMVFFIVYHVEKLYLSLLVADVLYSASCKTTRPIFFIFVWKLLLANTWIFYIGHWNYEACNNYSIYFPPGFSQLLWKLGVSLLLWVQWSSPPEGREYQTSSYEHSGENCTWCGLHWYASHERHP